MERQQIEDIVNSYFKLGSFDLIDLIQDVIDRIDDFNDDNDIDCAIDDVMEYFTNDVYNIVNKIKKQL